MYQAIPENKSEESKRGYASPDAPKASRTQRNKRKRMK